MTATYDGGKAMKDPLSENSDFMNGYNSGYADALRAVKNAPAPRLTKPARVGAGTFHIGVETRLVVECAQRVFEQALKDDPAERARYRLAGIAIEALRETQP